MIVRTLCHSGLAWAAAVVAFTAGPSSGLPAQSAPSAAPPAASDPAAPPAPPALPQRAAATDDAAREELEVLARAQRVLEARGYAREASRLDAIRRELEASARVRSAEERARGLAQADLGDVANRVAILELGVAGYRATGSTTNADALAWFAELGRAQRDGRQASLGAMPAGANADGGTVMDRMVELVLGASVAHEGLGNRAAARCCMRLGRWYIEREVRARDSAVGGAPATGMLAAPLGADTVPLRVTPVTPPGAEPLAAEPAPPMPGGAPPAAGAPPLPSTDVERELRALRARIEALQRELDAAEAKAPGRRTR